MKRELLISEFLSTPWALMPERLNAMTAVLARWNLGIPAGQSTMANIEAAKEARAARAASVPTQGGIAVLPLYGIVTQRGNMADDVSGPGSVSTQQFGSALTNLINDDSVGQILIDIDSPGGSVYGVSELADQIIAARTKKPIVAIANSLAASAAYWIGCSASEFYVTPGGEVGSIGVWQAHNDYSKALADEGVVTTLISAGKFKVEGNPYEPLDEEARAFMQSRVDDYYSAFTKAVAKGRGVPIDTVRNGMGQGRVLGADEALANKMVDGVATFDDVLSQMKKKGQATRMPAKASRLSAATNELKLIA